MTEQERGWAVSEGVVTSSITRLEKSFDAMNKTLVGMQIELGKMKMRLGVFGILATSLPILVYLLMQSQITLPV